MKGTGGARFLRIWIALVVVLGLGALPLLDLLLLDWSGRPTVQWIGGVEARKRVAAQAAGNGARLLVVGGSSATFSVDAELLETRLGLPTVNLATHAGLGLRYLLAEARTVAHAGDTILLHLEFAHYRNKPLPVLDIERQALWTLHPRRLLQLPMGEALRQIYGVPFSDYREGWERRDQQMKAADLPPRLYSIVELGPRGDYRSGAPRDQPAPALDLKGVNEPRRDAEKLLTDFFAWCDGQKVKVIAVRPAAVRTRGADPAEIERAYHVVEPLYAKAQVPLLDTRDLFQLPSELFFDTCYHATASGRRLITEHLARQLAPHFGKQPVRQNDTIMLLAAARSGRERDLIMTTGTSPEFRFLSATDLHHPLCVSTADVARLCQQRRRVVFTDPEAGALLAAAGLKSVPLDPRNCALDDLVDEKRDWIYAFVQIGNFPKKLPASYELLFPASTTPSFIPAYLRRPQEKVAVVGTGAFTHVHFAPDESLELQIDRRAPWQRHLRFPVPFDLSARSATPITIDGSPLMTVSEPGLAVAVYDPATGVIVHQGFFTGLEMTKWQLSEVQAPL